MTERLYYTDPYLTEFEAHVLDVQRLDARHGIVLDRMTELGAPMGIGRIKEIDTGEKYWALQDRLQKAAEAAQVPRVWFGDVWATNRAESQHAPAGPPKDGLA